MTGEAVLRVRRATCSQYRQQRRKRGAKIPPLHGVPCPILAGFRCPYFAASVPVIGSPSKASVRPASVVSRPLAHSASGEIGR